MAFVSAVFFLARSPARHAWFPLVTPIPLTPPSLAVDVPWAAKDAAKLADEAAVRAYDQQVLAYEEALPT